MQPRSYEPRAGFGIRIVHREGVQRRPRERLAAPRPIIGGHHFDIAEEQASIAASIDPRASPDAPMSDHTHGACYDKKPVIEGYNVCYRNGGPTARAIVPFWRMLARVIGLKPRI